MPYVQAHQFRHVGDSDGKRLSSRRKVGFTHKIVGLTGQLQKDSVVVDGV